MTYQIRNWTYETKQELREGAEYIENDLNYLKNQLPKYQNNPFVFEKVQENIAHTQTLLSEFLELL